MKSILSSAHVHTTFCDGKSTAQEMARTAYEMGFVSLGFTSHAPQMFDPAHCIDPSRECDYINEIRRIKQEICTVARNRLSTIILLLLCIISRYLTVAIVGLMRRLRLCRNI